MFKYKYILFILSLFVLSQAQAQKTYREHLRSGNKLYVDSLYEKAEVEYRKALEFNPEGGDALYNLGNALLYQNKAQDAMEHFMMAEKRESDKKNLAQIHHNMGVICQAAKDYAKAVEFYKQALRENSTDHETRYNLALAMHQLKEQQNKQQQQQDNQQQEQQEKEQEQEQQQQEQQQQEQQEKEQQQQPEQQEQQEQEMSKENAEQLLESAMQDEKDVQEKVKKMMQVRGRKLDKDW